MSEVLICFICLILLFVLLAMGVHVGFALFFVGFVGFWWCVDFKGAIGTLGTATFTNASNYTFSVIPLFVLMGNYAFASGISNGLYDFGSRWLNKLPGGLACSTVVACAAFGAICGSAQATTATMGTVALPEMRKYGYNDSLSSGCIAAGGTLGFLIPPSSAFIVYGICTENSIGTLFAAGVVPGLLLALFWVITIVILVKMNPSLCEPSKEYTWKERIVSLKSVIPIVILFGFVMGGIFGGVFSTSEAAVAGSFLAFIFIVINRKLNRETLSDALMSSVSAFGMSFLLIVGAGIFGNFLTVSGVPAMLSEFVAGLNVSRYVILAIIVLIYAFLGCIMEGAAMVLITVPIFYPIMTSLGFDGIWFGVLIVVVTMLGQITPPVGLCAYVIAGVAGDIPLQTVFKGIVPYLAGIVVIIIAITVFPQIVLWLPGLLQ